VFTNDELDLLMVSLAQYEHHFLPCLAAAVPNAVLSGKIDDTRARCAAMMSRLKKLYADNMRAMAAVAAPPSATLPGDGDVLASSVAG
jgi:hypothetical protein